MRQGAGYNKGLTLLSHHESDFQNVTPSVANFQMTLSIFSGWLHPSCRPKTVITLTTDEQMVNDVNVDCHFHYVCFNNETRCRGAKNTPHPSWDPNTVIRF